jgi:hypothetical protein
MNQEPFLVGVDLKVNLRLPTCSISSWAFRPSSMGSGRMGQATSARQR